MPRMIKLRIISILGLLIIIAILLIFIIRLPKVDRGSDIVMDSALTMTIYTRQSLFDCIGNDNICSELSYEARSIDNELLDWRNPASECYSFNKLDIKSEGYIASDDFLDIISQSEILASQTDGAVDPALGMLIDVWNIEDSYGRDDYTPPGADELEKISPHIGYSHLDINDNIITSDTDSLKLDFGAVGKGYTLDRLCDILQDDSDCTGAVISMGSSILVYGCKNDKSPYEIGIRDPEDGISDILGTIRVDSSGRDGVPVYISTSGSYERYAASEDGTVYSHILDSSTLRPVDSDLLSVTVVCESGIASDGLSTALFVIGEEDSDEILEEYGAEAIFIYSNHDIHVTGGLEKIIDITNDNYRIVVD